MAITPTPVNLQMAQQLQQDPLIAATYAPSYDEQNADIKRRMALAQALKGTRAPTDTQMVSGYAVKNSPLVGLGALSQALLGGYQEKQATKQEGDLNKGRLSALTAIMNNPNAKPEDIYSQLATNPALGSDLNMMGLTQGFANRQALQSQAATEKRAQIAADAQSAKDDARYRELEASQARMFAHSDKAQARTIASQADRDAAKTPKRNPVEDAANKKRLEALDTAAFGAQNTAGLASQAEALVNQGVYGAGLTDRAAMVAHSFGLNDAPKASNTEALKQIGAQLVLAKGTLGAGVSVYDAQTYAKAAGEFQNAKNDSDRVKAIGVMREVSQRQIDKANQAHQMYEETGKLPAFELPPGQGSNAPTQAGAAPAAQWGRDANGNPVRLK